MLQSSEIRAELGTESDSRTFPVYVRSISKASSRRGIIATVVEYAGADQCRKVNTVFPDNRL
jgi:hypothetical protein